VGAGRARRGSCGRAGQSSHRAGGWARRAAETGHGELYEWRPSRSGWRTDLVWPGWSRTFSRACGVSVSRGGQWRQGPGPRVKFDTQSHACGTKRMPCGSSASRSSARKPPQPAPWLHRQPAICRPRAVCAAASSTARCWCCWCCWCCCCRNTPRRPLRQPPNQALRIRARHQTSHHQRPLPPSPPRLRRPEHPAAVRPSKTDGRRGACTAPPGRQTTSRPCRQPDSQQSTVNSQRLRGRHHVGPAQGPARLPAPGLARRLHTRHRSRKPQAI